MASARTLNAMTQWVKRNPLLGGVLFILLGFFIFKEGVDQGRKAVLVQQSPTFEGKVEELTREEARRGGYRVMAQLAYVGSDGAQHRCRMQVKSKLNPSKGSRVDVKAESPYDCILATEAAEERVFHLGRTPMSGLSFFGMGSALFGLAVVIFRNRFLGDPE